MGGQPLEKVLRSTQGRWAGGDPRATDSHGNTAAEVADHPDSGHPRSAEALRQAEAAGGAQTTVDAPGATGGPVSLGGRKGGQYTVTAVRLA